MKGYVPDYDVVVPASLAEALRCLADEGATLRPIAGGTDLMVLLESGKLPPGRYLSLWRLKELRGIDVKKGHVTLGALTTYADLLGHRSFPREYPILAAAARETGAVAIQSRGTLGGNVANASPAADSPPGLLVYDAEVGLLSATGVRWLPYGEFHRGYKKTALRPDELVGWLRLPRRSGKTVSYWRKVGTRRAQAISKVCLAATARVGKGALSEVRLAFGSVAPVPLRCPRTESALSDRKLDGKALAEARLALESELTPIDDIRSTAEYRRRVAWNLVAEFVQSAL